MQGTGSEFFTGGLMMTTALGKTSIPFGPQGFGVYGNV